MATTPPVTGLRPYDNSALLELVGVRTHVQTWSPVGEPRATVVGLHHFYGSAQTYHRLGPLLADVGLRLVAFDRVGFGFTDRPHPAGRWTGPEAPYTRAFAVRQVEELLDRLDVNRAIVTGTSMGGTVAIEFALAHPDRVEHLVPCSAALTGDASAFPRLRRVLRTQLSTRVGTALVGRLAGDIDRARLARSWHDPSGVDDADVDAHARFREAVGWEQALWWKYVADVPPDLARRLPDLAAAGVPVTAIGATHDRIVRPEVARRLASAASGDYVEVECGHLAHCEGARRLAEVLDRIAAP